MTLRPPDEDIHVAQALSDARRRSAARLAVSAGHQGNSPILWRQNTLICRNGVCYYNPEGDPLTLRLPKTRLQS